MSGECQKCGEHCLDCKCSEKVNLHEMIEDIISGLDSNMMKNYNIECEEGSKEWYYNHGCVYAFSVCIGILKGCLSLDGMKNDRSTE